MATVITMPRLSDTMTEGTVATWLKKVGDKIKFRRDIHNLGYKTDIYGDIPSNMIIHGNASFCRNIGNQGIIEGFYGGYIICSYISQTGGKVQLGFVEEDIILPTPSEPNYEVY